MKEAISKVWYGKFAFRIGSLDNKFRRHFTTVVAVGKD
jgi:hypothetical protein